VKISVIGGAGTLGATSAFVMAQQQLADEICLIDIKENVAKSHEMDMSQAVASFSRTIITSGGFERLAGSDLVIITVGIPETKVASRMDYLHGNVGIIEQISQHIKEYAPQSILVTATNPLDVINSVLPRYLGTDPRRIIGFSLNDTFRFRWAIAQVLGEKIDDIHAMVVGEHGEDQVPLFSQVLVKGQPHQFSAEQMSNVVQIIRNWFAEYQSLNSGRTSGWLSAVNIARVVGAIVNDTREVLPCSVIDADGISIGRPVMLGKHGVEQMVEMIMSEEEEKQWGKAKEKIAGVVASLWQEKGK
jgi:malate dehydrogenase